DITLRSMRLDNYLQYTCSTFACNGKAVIELTLEHYQVIYGCVMHETALRRRYRDANIVRLDLHE
ncbi:MAG TPA: hypothetical protein VJZ03_02800, partial [Candidatus Bathyarchaeia archaeon]|nr:hypothetical protein [Candidatus Bathyarchaeia archaeon]